MKYLNKINETIENKKLVIISGDDWEGIYIDGKLIDEGHSIDWRFVLKVLGYNISGTYIEDEEFWEIGNLPDKLEDLEVILNSKKYNL